MFKEGSLKSATHNIAYEHGAQNSNNYFKIYIMYFDCPNLSFPEKSHDFH